MTNKEIAKEIAKTLEKRKLLQYGNRSLIIEKTASVIEKILDENYLDEDEEIDENGNVVKISQK